MGKQYQIRNGVVTEITPQVAAIVGRNVGEIVHSIVPLVDANLHLLDGTQLQDDGIYADGIARIKALQTNYPGLFTTEADWQASVTQYDACGKFVIGDGTLRLPKITKFIEGTTDATALGDLVEAGAPEISGSGSSIPIWSNAGWSGAFSDTTVVSGNGTNSSAGTYRATLRFNASDSNAVYGNSTTVQPQSIKGFFYIVLGTFPKSSAVVDMDNVATDLNSKTTAEQAAHAAMPSNTTKTLANPSASGQEYTMEADGYFTFYCMSSASSGNAYVHVYRNGVRRHISITNISNASVCGEIAVSAGDVVKLAYALINASTWSVTFSYCNGNAHLAS